MTEHRPGWQPASCGGARLVNPPTTRLGRLPIRGGKGPVLARSNPVQADKERLERQLLTRVECQVG